jgi:hypothetical protein
MTLREQLFDVAARWVGEDYAHWMAQGDPLTLVRELAARAWLERHPDDFDTQVIRAVRDHLHTHGTLPVDQPGIAPPTPDIIEPADAIAVGTVYREFRSTVAAFVTQAISPDATGSTVAALATAMLEAAALLVCCVGRLDEPATEADRAWALAQTDQAAQRLADDVERYFLTRDAAS